MGMNKSAAYLIGTWHTADGDIHHFLREVTAYQSGAILSVFSNRDSTLLPTWATSKPEVSRGDRNDIR